MKTYNVYVIIVSYNGMQWMDKCLSTVSASDIPLKIIVIDNGSTDGTQDFVCSKYKNVNFIQNTENAGFGKANNIGMLQAIEDNADYVFLLNQDAYVEPDTISKLVNYNVAHPEYGVLSPKQMNGNGTAFDKNFQNFVLAPVNIISHNAEVFYTVKFVMAALWLISGACLEKTGVFDPIFPHYAEDNDYLNRAIYHDFNVGILMDSVGYHDREFRDDNEQKKLYITYAGLLAQLMDINAPFSTQLKKVSRFHFRSTAHSLKWQKWTLMLAAQKKYFHLLKLFSKIKQARMQNERGFRK